VIAFAVLQCPSIYSRKSPTQSLPAFPHHKRIAERPNTSFPSLPLPRAKSQDSRHQCQARSRVTRSAPEPCQPSATRPASSCTSHRIEPVLSPSSAHRRSHIAVISAQAPSGRHLPSSHAQSGWHLDAYTDRKVFIAIDVVDAHACTWAA
jgi:hypothetical protein